MIPNAALIAPGKTLVSPGGKRHVVKSVFVPKNNLDKSHLLPSAFRNVGRSVVLFTSGAVIQLSEAKRVYSLWSDLNCA